MAVMMPKKKKNLSTPSQAEPETLEEASEEGVPEENQTAKPASPKKVKVTSADQLRSIYKKKFGKKSAAVEAEGDTLEGEDEDYKKLGKMN
jgi:hypothetical protein